MLLVIRHLFHVFLFVYLFIFPNADDIMMLLQYFVCCITHPFRLWRQTFGKHWTTHNDASINQWHLRVKHAFVHAEGGHFKHM